MAAGAARRQHAGMTEKQQTRVLADAPRRAPLRRHRVGMSIAAVVAVLVVAIGVCEWWGWPFLARPIENTLASTLDRKVALRAADAASAPSQRDIRIRFFGGLSVAAPHLEIGAPAWSRAPHMLLASDGALQLRYIDLWRARDGAPLRIRRLEAERLDAIVERTADGRASWQFGARPAADDEKKKTALPDFDRLHVGDGRFSYRDEALQADIKGRFTLLDGGDAPPPDRPNGLRVDAEGRYRDRPLKAELRSIGVLPWIAKDAAVRPVPLMIEVSSGAARFRFDGSATDLMNLAGLGGRFALSGPSLAAIGDPIGVTLPTTHPFRSAGALQKQSEVWNVRIEDWTVGDSRLNASLRYDGGRAVPLLEGRVGGAKLLLSDLGPAIGADSKGEAKAAPKAAAAASAPGGRVLPDRAFDLPSLRAMDANVLLNFAELDLNSERIEPLRPLRAHLTLRSGVLKIDDIEARTGAGSLRGSVGLDGTAARAVWRTDLHWEGVHLDRWIKQSRPDGQPPYVSGELRGYAKLEGRGRSTAEILGGMGGQLRTELRHGTISHLAMEAAGLDLAQALGVFVRGDRPLAVHCGLADLRADKGVLTPRALVVDTSDSVVWFDGTVSLADEALDLRAVVTPKDFSPLSLRAPLRVRGTLGDPKFALEAGRLVPRIGAAGLLALLNPLAAIVPFIEIGTKDAADGNGCAALVKRAAAAAGNPSGNVAPSARR